MLDALLWYFAESPVSLHIHSKQYGILTLQSLRGSVRPVYSAHSARCMLPLCRP
jgi:hypothetical protein